MARDAHAIGPSNDPENRLDERQDEAAFWHFDTVLPELCNPRPIVRRVNCVMS
jgi:hypothetical protein